ncbi:uncharacterized protein LOC131659581 [Vicia villosa]|uniref:uncharacterized protein LOC131659581 n=1 Tax=Vicia villosa TaxID=3911 RepID=UPI00273CD0AD|nr:uncharacterized protein LOC131659581 [Vicia villosa]
MIRDKVKQAQDRQRSYEDNCRRPLEFVEGDHVFLKVTPRLRLKGPFKSLLLDAIEIESDLTFEPLPSRIVGKEIKVLRNKEIPLVKVQWDVTHPGDATWELESEMQDAYPHLFRLG